MKTERGWWALAGLGVLTLVGLYVGAYYAMMFRIQTVAFYRVSWEWQDEAEAFFGPINEVDRWLRPAIWSAPYGGLSSEWGEPHLAPSDPSDSTP